MTMYRLPKSLGGWSIHRLPSTVAFGCGEVIVNKNDLIAVANRENYAQLKKELDIATKNYNQALSNFNKVDQPLSRLAYAWKRRSYEPISILKQKILKISKRTLLNICGN